jgi:cell fate (sporulation/competence/biofilm development) regulator YmcA (YheA/YmcA/DUF963 family)
MEINKKAKEFAMYVKNTEEFKYMNKCKEELEKNKALKNKLNSYISKKNSIYSNYKIEDATRKISSLNNEYENFFNTPIVSNYLSATKEFNLMMENLYKTIEKELLK